uniref:Putative rho-associated coiled-coil n=1 Tax=Amblyomma aureolatum TaxID=187763 RepID=A0A1E1XDW0_9ACAR
MSRRDSTDAANSPHVADSDDNEFGEFEGAVGGAAAHPAPSPWAAFPDLIRVRTSPGGTASIGSEGSLQHAEGQGDNPSGPRVRNPNPPDVSLHAREGAPNDDVNLLNFIPSSHQRVGGALPDMAAESELRHTMQVSSSLSPAARDHIAEVRPTLRGSPHDAGSSSRRGGDQPGTLASMAANVQRSSALCRSARPSCGRDNCPDAVDAAALRESNSALTRRLSASESRVRDLENQLRDLREREARNERNFQLIVNELHGIRETLMALEHASRSVTERLEAGVDSGLASAAVKEASAIHSVHHHRSSVEDRLTSIETSLDRLYSRLPNLGRTEVVLEPNGSSPAAHSLTKEDITLAVQEALLRQSSQQKALLEDERRRLMQSFAESFQVAISQFLQSLNSDNLDS